MKNKKEKKVFTKNEEKGIIRLQYNLFIANNKNLQRKGFFMKEAKEIVVNELTEELNWKEKLIVNVFNKTFNKVVNLVRINTVNKMIR
jgi:hypothetical protein